MFVTGCVWDQGSDSREGAPGSGYSYGAGRRRLASRAPPRPWGILGAGRGGAGEASLSRARGGGGGRAAARAGLARRPVAFFSRQHGPSADVWPTTRRTGFHPGLRGGAGEVQRYGASGPCLPFRAHGPLQVNQLDSRPCPQLLSPTVVPTEPSHSPQVSPTSLAPCSFRDPGKGWMRFTEPPRL